jgi:4-amino-4-deoxy-L-arabinose transferase-like glycosyltransferase
VAVENRRAPLSGPAARRHLVRQRWPPLLVVGLVVLSGLLHLWWLHRFRDGFPLDIDESRYLEFGLDLKDGLDADGLPGLWHSWEAQTDFGPLLPLSSVPVYAVLGESVINGLATQLGFYALLVLATYGIGARLTSPAGGALAALAVAATPAVIDLTRSYEFPVTAAAMLAASTYALLASDGLERRGWSVAWGVLLGLTVLARTMTVAFIPAQLLAALWLAAVRPGARRRRFENLAIATTAGLICAATWFATSWHAAWSYLTNLGYGSQSAGVGTAESRLTVGYWTRELTETVRDDLYLPLGVLLGLGLCLGFVACVVGLRRRGAEKRLRDLGRAWASSDTAVVLLVVLEGYLALASSRNQGVGFRLPLIPGLVALSVAGIWTLRRPRLRGLVAGALVVVCALNLAMKANMTSALSGSETVDVPGLGATPLLQGDGYIHDYVLSSLEASRPSSTRPLPESQKRWLPAYRQLVGQIRAHGPSRAGLPVVGLATQEPLVNANNLTLAARLRFHENLAVVPLGAPAGAATATSYRQLLSRAPAPDVLVTVSSLGLSYAVLTGGVSIDQRLMRLAARSLGFERVAAVELPGERRAIVSARD